MTHGIKVKIISLILTMLILFQILPVTVFAEEMSGTTDEATVQDTGVSEYDTADMYYHLGTRYDYNKDGELLNIYNTIDYSSSSGIENDTILNITAAKYFYKTAHNSAKEFVFSSLGKSSGKNVVGSVTMILKNYARRALGW